MSRQIYCSGCDQIVQARLTDGAERYPHRPDLAKLPMYTHDPCGSWVGTHHKTSNPLRPLGVLATRELMDYRMAIHGMIDPIWQQGHMTRAEVYAHMSKELGFSYHTGAIRSITEAKRVWKTADELLAKVVAKL